MSKVVRVSRDGAHSIVRVGDAYVRVDHQTHETTVADKINALTAGAAWRTATSVERNSLISIEIANASATSLNINEMATNEGRRVYRVPNVVKDEALRGLSLARTSPKNFDPELVQLAARVSVSVSVDIDTIRSVAARLSEFSRDDLTAFADETVDTESSKYVSWTMLGGNASTRWTERVLNKHAAITAGAFTFEADAVYLGGGDDPESTKISRLYKVARDSDEYFIRAHGEWQPTEEPTDALLVELDAESAETVANWADDLPEDAPADAYVELRTLLPVEHNLFDLARDYVDYDFLDRVSLAAAGVWDDGRAPQERQETASRQGRDGGGQFVKGQTKAKGTNLGSFAKGRLPGDLPVLENILERINAYLADVEQQRGAAAPVDDTDAPVVAAPAPESVTVEEATPDTTDVAPLYVAVVDDADVSAVLDLAAIVPAKAGTNQGPTAWRRANGAWEFAPDLMSDLQSVSPPPVVELKDEELVKNVLQQIDQNESQSPDEADGGSTMAASGMWGPNGELLPLYAAGVPTVADTPKEVGNAERLRQYWTHGEGAAKIGWGAPGDWYRCVSHLSKYMGSRAKGYCTLRHKDALGVWPGQEDGKKDGKALRASAEDRLAPIKFEQSLVHMGILAAAARVDENDFVPVEMQEAMIVDGDTLNAFDTGGAFVIPVLIPEDLESGDGRSFDEQSLTVRDLPLPLLWQVFTAEGHQQSVIVGRIDSIERLTDQPGLGRAVGVFDVGPYGQEAERLVRAKMLRGVSADLDKFEANVLEESEAELADDSEDSKSSKSTIKNDKIRATQARVMAATLVPKPSFQECEIIMADDPNMDLGVAIEPLEDGIYEEAPVEADEAEVVLASIAASAAPVQPPRSWFNDPSLDKATPLTVTDDGKVFGHIAAWHVDHIGLPRATKPPRSSSNYAYFRTGMLRTEEGDDVAVGQLTLAGGHAPLSAGAEAAVKHYDDTASAIADVAAGEDAHGIWVAGALRPGVTPEQVRVLRASAPSGDWRPINGRLELVAVCQVNVPGFPVARAFVASGSVTALVAAGASYMAQLRDEPIRSLEARVASIESEALNEKREAALARIEPQARARREALVAAAEAARARIKPIADEKQAEKDALIASANEARARMGLKSETPESTTLDANGASDDSNF